MRTYQTQDATTTDGCYNLRNTDGSIEQAQISTHVTIALQGIGNEGERHCQHGCPTGTNHQKWDKLQVLVVKEWNESKAHTTDNQADCVCHLGILELRKNHSPKHTTYCLNSEENTYPVTCLLELCRFWIGSIPNCLGDGTGRIVPEI